MLPNCTVESTTTPGRRDWSCWPRPAGLDSPWSGLPGSRRAWSPAGRKPRMDWKTTGTRARASARSTRSRSRAGFLAGFGNRPASRPAWAPRRRTGHRPRRPRSPSAGCRPANHSCPRRSSRPTPAPSPPPWTVPTRQRFPRSRSIIPSRSQPLGWKASRNRRGHPRRCRRSPAVARRLMPSRSRSAIPGSARPAPMGEASRPSESCPTSGPPGAGPVESDCICASGAIGGAGEPSKSSVVATPDDRVPRTGMTA